MSQDFKNNDKKPSILDVIIQKDVTDAIFKNLTWYFACAAILKLTIIVSHYHQAALALSLIIFFCFLFSLNMIFGVQQILLPIDSAFGNSLTKVKHANAHPDQNDFNRFKRTMLYLFATRIGLFYLSISSIYVTVSFQVVALSAQVISTGQSYP